MFFYVIFFFLICAIIIPYTIFCLLVALCLKQIDQKNKNQSFPIFWILCSDSRKIYAFRVREIFYFITKWI